MADLSWMNPSPDAAPNTSAETEPAFMRRTGWASTFDALRYRNFRILWFSSLMISGGVWLQQVSLGWLVYNMTESPLQVGAVLGTRSAPLILAPLTGVLVDRVDRRKLLLTAQASVTVLVLGFSALLFSGREEVWHLYAFALSFGLIWAVNNPVRQTLVANAVPRKALMNATALNSLAFNAMRAVGPAVGGVLIVLSGPAINFFLQGVLFALVVLLLWRFRAEYGGDNQASARRESPLRNLIEGFRYVAEHKPTLLLILMTFVVTVTILGSVFNMIPVYVPEVLGDDGGGQLGFLMTSLGIGGLFGTILLARFSYFERKGLQTLVAFGGAALTVIAMSQVDTLWMAAIVLGFYQVFAQTVLTTNMTMVQGMTPDHLRGRVVGVYQMEIGLMPIGGVTAGAIANFWGVQTAFLVAGTTAIVVVLLIAAFSPSIRNMRL
jgi:MFS family permease